MHDQCKRALIYIMRLLKEKQFSIFKFNFVMEDLMHTMSLVHLLLSKAIVCSMPSVFVFILAEQKNEQHTPIILFTPSIYVTKIVKKIFWKIGATFDENINANNSKSFNHLNSGKRSQSAYCSKS